MRSARPSCQLKGSVAGRYRSARGRRIQGRSDGLRQQGRKKRQWAIEPHTQRAGVHDVYGADVREQRRILCGRPVGEDASEAFRKVLWRERISVRPPEASPEWTSYVRLRSEAFHDSAAPGMIEPSGASVVRPSNRSVATARAALSSAARGSSVAGRAPGSRRSVRRSAPMRCASVSSPENAHAAANIDARRPTG